MSKYEFFLYAKLMQFIDGLDINVYLGINGRLPLMVRHCRPHGGISYLWFLSFG